MAKIGQLYYNVDGVGTTQKLTLDVLKTELIPAFLGNITITKLGIQAEPGTKVQINGTDIIIGRTGVFELDEKIPVTSLKFVPEPIWELDEQSTTIDKAKALSLFKVITSSFGINTVDIDTIIAKAANNEVLTKEEQDKINKWWTENETSLKDWINRYSQQNTIYFNPGYNYYLQGENGVYVHANNGTKNRDFHNLIIDYVAEDN